MENKYPAPAVQTEPEVPVNQNEEAKTHPVEETHHKEHEKKEETTHHEEHHHH